MSPIFPRDIRLSHRPERPGPPPGGPAARAGAPPRRHIRVRDGHGHPHSVDKYRRFLLSSEEETGNTGTRLVRPARVTQSYRR